MQDHWQDQVSQSIINLDFDRAKLFLFKIINDAPTAESYYKLAICHQNLEEYNEAEDAFKKSIALNAKYYAALEGLANLLAVKKKFEECLETIDLALNLNQTPQLTMFKVRILYELGRMDEALHIMEGLLALNLKPEMYEYKIMLLESTKNYDSMLDTAISGITLFPQYYNFLLNKAQALIAMEKYSNAKSDLITFLKFKQENAKAWKMLESIYLNEENTILSEKANNNALYHSGNSGEFTDIYDPMWI
ncbi:MAG: hypothetical protein INQ03_22585 [Candidatus Heimdallarchaeota archaeon]|nr:hypothetical protein [Candidatus Heimdallarchaeota archaeon]